MHAIALERMEEFARSVLRLAPEMQTEFFAEMVKGGTLSEDEAEGLKQYVGLYHMFTDQRYYDAMRDGVKALYMSEANR